MPADQAFYDRIKRIERGKQWAPGGVIHKPKAKEKKSRKRVNGGVGLLLGIALTAPVLGLVLGPEHIPPQILGLLETPAAEAALARLGQIELIASIIDR